MSARGDLLRHLAVQLEWWYHAGAPVTSSAIPQYGDAALLEEEGGLSARTSPRLVQENLAESSSEVCHLVRNSSTAAGTSRASSARSGHIVKGNSDSATLTTRKTPKVDLHGMHKRFVRVQSARQPHYTRADLPGTLPTRPATQGGTPVVGQRLRSYTMATGASAPQGMHAIRGEAAALATAEEEGLSAWQASLDGWDGDAAEQHAGVAAEKAGRGVAQRRELRSRGAQGSGVASHRMVVAAASAAKKRRDSGI